MSNKWEEIIDDLENVLFDLTEERVYDAMKDLGNIITYLRKTVKMTVRRCYNVPNKRERHCNGTSFTKLIGNKKSEYLLYCVECGTEYKGIYKQEENK